MSEQGSPSPGKLYGLLGMAIMVWALNFIVSKWALREFPALLLALLRMCVAGVCIWPMYLLQKRPKPPRSEWRKLLLICVGCAATNQISWVVGISRTSVAHAAFLVGLTPILVHLLASALGHERISARRLAGIGVALSGVMVLQLGKSQGSATLAGDLLIVASAAIFATFLVLGKKSSGEYGPVTMSAFTYCFGGLIFLPLLLLESRSFDYGTVSLHGWLSMLYMSLFSSVLGYLVYNWALGHIPASRLSTFSYSQPVLASTLAIPLLGEHLTVTLVTAGAMVLLGVFISERGG